MAVSDDVESVEPFATWEDEAQGLAERLLVRLDVAQVSEVQGGHAQFCRIMRLEMLAARAVGRLQRRRLKHWRANGQWAAYREGSRAQ